MDKHRIVSVQEYLKAIELYTVDSGTSVGLRKSVGVQMVLSFTWLQSTMTSQAMGKMLRCIYATGSVSSALPVLKGQRYNLLVSSSTLAENSFYSILNHSDLFPP